MNTNTLPQLIGSDEQIKMASDLRYSFVTALKSQTAAMTAEIVEAIAAGDSDYVTEHTASRDKMESQAEIVLKAAVNARLWIDVLFGLVTPDYGRGTGINRMALDDAARRRRW